MKKSQLKKHRVIQLIFLVYWMTIFEGAFRKWFFPQFNQIIFFLKDPVILLIYYYALQYKLFINTKVLQVTVFLASLSILLIIAQSITTGITPVVLIYGWRNYFFYIPLSFVIAYCFSYKELNRLVYWNMLLAIPMGVLSYIQHTSPRLSFINKDITGSENIFVVAGNIVRVTSTFTFTVGHSLYVSSLFAMMLYCWVQGKSIISNNLLIISSFSIIIMLLTSGARTTFVNCGLIYICYFYYSFIAHRNMAKKIRLASFGLFSLIIGVVIFSYVVPDSLEAMQSRVDAAGNSENFIDRIADTFLMMFEPIEDTPWLGYGIGLGSSGGTYIATGGMGLILSEWEWPRIIQELGPIIGIFVILFRIWVVLDLFQRSKKAATKYKQVLPLLFFGFIGVYLLNQQISKQGTIMAYAWLFYGFTLSAITKKVIYN